MGALIPYVLYNHDIRMQIPPLHSSNAIYSVATMLSRLTDPKANVKPQNPTFDASELHRIL